MSIVLNGEEFSVDDFRGMNHVRNVPAGFGRPTEPLFPDRIFAQMVNVIDQNVDASGDAAASAAAAAASASTSTSAANTAVAAKDLAVAAAASADFPTITTSGTASAYTLNFTPDRIVGDMFAMRVKIHVDCNDNPTFSVDGGTTYGAVDGTLIDANGAYAPIGAKRLKADARLIFIFDATLNKFVVFGLPVFGSLFAVFRPPISLSINQTFALNDSGTLQRLTGTDARTWTIPTNAAVAFPIGTEIDIKNASTQNLTLVASSGVTVNGVVTPTMVLLAKEHGQLKKVGTNEWDWRGWNEDGWAV